MKPALQLRVGQQLSMTPQLQQAIRLLQLSALDLQQEIQTALENNPLLEMAEMDQEADQAEKSDNLDDFDRNEENPDSQESQETLDNWDPPLESRIKERNTAHTGQEIERLSSEATTLNDHLIWQMQLTPFTLQDKLIAISLIDAIDEDGYLTSSLEDIQLTLKNDIEVDIDEIEAVLHLIQQFDPIGVGARDLSECLTIQLKALPPEHPWRDKAIALVSHDLSLLGKRDYAALRRNLGLSMDDLRSVIQCIQTQHPKPGQLIANTPPEYIIPDVYVRKRAGKWVIELNPECTPEIKINQQYAALIRRSDSSRDNQFLKSQLQEARWFLKSIENRHETLIKVATAIVNAQADFFDQGEAKMKPLVLSQIAEQVNMHESTISRVTSHKYMHTPLGTFELKYFFSSHVGTDTGGECSSTAIRAIIKKLIAEENRQKPLSDDKLAKLLAHEGIKVARRTVAKYREAMTIPPSHERKKLL